MVSHVVKLIPDSVRNRWNEYRAALKEARQSGNSEQVEIVGWGVEEAEERNKSDASTTFLSDLTDESGMTDHNIRSWYPTGARLRHSQELHFPPSPAGSCRDAQGRQGAAILGLEYRKATSQAVTVYQATRLGSPHSSLLNL